MKMKTIFPLLVLVLALAGGCRREDIRTMTITMPELTEADVARVEAALSPYGGIDKTSYRWDVEAKTLTLSYDSMKIAQSNIRYAIDEKGVKVAFPKKEGNHAGY